MFWLGLLAGIVIGAAGMYGALRYVADKWR